MSGYRIFAQRVGLVAVTNLLLGLSGMVLLPILTKGLSIEEYGLWVQISVTLGLVPNVINLGLPYSMVRFLAAAKDRGEMGEDFYSILAIVLLMASLTSGLLYIASAPISSLLFDGRSDVIRLLSPLIVLECIYLLLINYLRTSQQIKLYSIIVSLKTTLNLLLVAIIIGAGYGLYGGLMGLFASSAFICLALFSLVVMQIGIVKPRFLHTRSHMSFGLPTVPGVLSSWLVESSDRYVIGIMMGSAFVGYYSPGYVLGYMVFMLMTPLFFMLPVVLSQQYDQCSIEAAKETMKGSLRALMGLAIPAAIGLSILSRPILEVLTTADIAARGYLITPFVSIGALFYGAYGVYAQVLVLEKRTGITGGIWALAAMANLGLNLALIPSMGILGAALATLVAYFGAFALTLHYSRKYMALETDLPFLAKSLASSLLMAILIMILDPCGIAGLALSTALGAAVYFISMYLMGEITSKEAAFLRDLLRH